MPYVGLSLVPKQKLDSLWKIKCKLDSDVMIAHNVFETKALRTFISGSRFRDASDACVYVHTGTVKAMFWPIYDRSYKDQLVSC